jgi:hypothetical protein
MRAFNTNEHTEAETPFQRINRITSILTDTATTPEQRWLAVALRDLESIRFKIQQRIELDNSSAERSRGMKGKSATWSELEQQAFYLRVPILPNLRQNGLETLLGDNFKDDDAAEMLTLVQETALYDFSLHTNCLNPTPTPIELEVFDSLERRVNRRDTPPGTQFNLLDS